MNGKKKVDSRLPRRLRLIHADFIELDLNIQMFTWIEYLKEAWRSGKRKSSPEKGSKHAVATALLTDGARSLNPGSASLE